MTRNEIQESIAGLLGDLLLKGVVDTASQAHIADTDLVFDLSNRLKGKELRFISV